MMSIEYLSSHLIMKRIYILFKVLYTKSWNKKQRRNIRKIIEISKNSDYTTVTLLDYEYFSNHKSLIEIELSKQIELENPELNPKINFISKLEKDNGATVIFIIEKKRRNNFWIFTKFCKHHIK